MSSSSPSPVRLRPAIGDAIGTTAFFRNRILFDTLLDQIAASTQQEVSVLFHACSIGAEVYSLVVQYLVRKLDQQFSLQCYATDKQPSFVDFARAASYPPEIIKGCGAEELRYFVVSDGEVKPADAVLARTEFLEASAFDTFTTTRKFDVVCLLNCLLYVPAATQSRVLAEVSGYNKRWLVTTGFHPETIKGDLQANGYSPILANIEQIHNGWTDRLRAEPIPAAQLPPHIFTDWSLQPFVKGEDFEYKLCALFSKRAD
jgi:hypothetical protein